MKDELSKSLKDATNLNEVRDAMIIICKQIKLKNALMRLGYVAGIIYSDGPEKVEENIRILNDHTEKIKKSVDFPIFSSPDIFNNGLFDRLIEAKLPRDESKAAFVKFHREILEQAGITDIFMTPRWEKSEGAKDEYETAVRLGLEIHYVE